MAADDVAWKVEHRYRAVREVEGGASVSEVAARYGVSRQSVYAWRGRYAEHGIAGLQEASRRPHRTPSRISPDVEAVISQLRQQHRRWVARGSSTNSNYVRSIRCRRGPRFTASCCANGLVNSQEQRHKRKYKRWQREAPMQLWQLDIVGGIFLGLVVNQVSLARACRVS